MQKIGIAFIIFVVFLFFSSFAYIGYEYNLPYVGSALRYVAGPFFAERITPEQILTNYETGKIKILIVPGHSNDSFGAQFRGIKEAQMNAELGQELLSFSEKTISLKLTPPAFKTEITASGSAITLNQIKKK